MDKKFKIGMIKSCRLMKRKQLNFYGHDGLVKLSVKKLSDELLLPVTPNDVLAYLMVRYLTDGYENLNIRKLISADLGKVRGRLTKIDRTKTNLANGYYFEIKERLTNEEEEEIHNF